MVYGIIRHHEGYISVDSDPERGGCFKIYLPVSKRALQEKAKPANANITTGSGTILLVDDEEIVRQLGKTILEELGYQVVPASDGQEACAIFAERKEQIDLVLGTWYFPIYRYSQRVFTAEHAEIAEKKQTMILLCVLCALCGEWYFRIY